MKKEILTSIFLLLHCSQALGAISTAGAMTVKNGSNSNNEEKSYDEFDTILTKENLKGVFTCEASKDDNIIDSCYVINIDNRNIFNSNKIIIKLEEIQYFIAQEIGVEKIRILNYHYNRYSGVIIFYYTY